jgi:hypothetical protein
MSRSRSNRGHVPTLAPSSTAAGPRWGACGPARDDPPLAGRLAYQAFGRTNLSVAV